MNISKYGKAVIAGLVAGAGALGTAAQDGTLTGSEGATIAAVTLGALAATWRVPNREPKDPA